MILVVMGQMLNQLIARLNNNIFLPLNPGFIIHYKEWVYFHINCNLLDKHVQVIVIMGGKYWDLRY